MTTVITEEFNNDRGKFVNYDSYDVSSRSAIRKLEHVNIRNFSAADSGLSKHVLDLSADRVSQLDSFTMNDLQSVPTPIAYRNAVALDGPVSYWRLGETTGPVARDSLGSNPGIYSGGYTLAQTGALLGDSNTATQFNGTDGLVTIPDAVNLRFYTSFTFEAWVKVPDRLANYPIISKTDNSTDRMYEFIVNTSGLLELAGTPGVVTGVAGTGTIPLNTWTHVAITWDGVNTLVFYINGQVDRTITSFWANSTAAGLQPVRIAGRGGERFKGYLDEVAAYNYALPASRILAHYKNGPTSGTGEKWSLGFYGEQATFNHQLGLLLTLGTGTTTTSSVLPNDPIDLATDFDDDDFVSIACPNYRGDIIDGTASYLDLTSSTDGTFTDASRVASLRFSDNLNGVSIFTNLSTNPSGENDRNGWAGWFTTPDGTVARSTAQAKVGSASIAFVPPSGGNFGGLNAPFSFTLNTVYSMSIWVRVPFAATWQCRWQDNNTSFTRWADQCPSGTSGVGPTTTGAGWIQFTWTGSTSPNAYAGDPRMVIYLQTTGGGAPNFAGETVYLDGHLVVKGSTLPGYFDGDTPGYGWTGTPHGSTSSSHLELKWPRSAIHASQPGVDLSKITAVRLRISNPTPYSKAVAFDGPISYWRLGESVGTTAADSVGSNPGTYTGGYTLGSTGALSGDPDTAVTFNGTSGYITVPDATNLRLIGDLTLEAWVKPTDYANFNMILAKQTGGAAGPYLWYLARTTGLPVAAFGNTSGDTRVTATAAPPTGQWSHVAVVVSGTTVTHYLNGIANGSGSIAGQARADSGASLRLGQDIFANFFKGALDEVAVYSYTLPASNILAHASAAYATNGFKSKGIRLLSKNWTRPPVDMDTRDDLLRQTFARDGGSASPDFTLPIMWRASTPTGHDPKPIDAEVEVLFNTGSQLFANSFSIFFREVTEDFLTMLDIDGRTMSSFDGMDMPDIGAAAFNSRTQTDLEAYDQEQLDQLDQYDLERIPDGIAASYLQATLQWASSGGTLSLLNSEGQGYTYNIPALPQGDYSVVISLVETGMRAKIFPLDSSQNMLAPIFDSTLANDDFVFSRRKGRIGWYASLQDGNAVIKSIRTRELTYAEYRSLPLESITPVEGAELFAQTAPDQELFTGFSYGSHTNDSPVTGDIRINVTRDTSRTLSGESFKIVSVGGLGLQGVESNVFTVTNWNEWDLRFSLYVPMNASANLRTFLLGEVGQVIELDLPELVFDQWQDIDIRFNQGDTTPVGNYKLALYQISTAPITFWVDNVSITQPRVAWTGRAIVDDPWDSNHPNWTPFRTNFNQKRGGVLFDKPGNQLQVRALALAEDAFIENLQFRPKYKELGRPVWSDSVLTGQTGPTANFGNTPTPGGAAHQVRFTSTSTPGSSPIVLYEWAFGDGTKQTGFSVDHQYAAAGTYPVTLTVTDSHGLHNQIITNIGA